jgi:hypothetical protein
MRSTAVFPVAAALLLVCSAGCVTSTLRITPAEPGRRSASGAPVTHVLEGMNTGVYLFYWIPLWTGNPNIPNQRNYDLFRHRVNDQAMYRMFAITAKRMRSSRVEEVQTSSRSSGVWTLWIFWKRSVHGRALLVREKRRPEKKTDAIKGNISDKRLEKNGNL